MENPTTQSNGDLLQLIAELEKPEVQESLTNLLGKLPEFEKNIASLGNVVDFGKAMLQDETSLSKYDELVSTYNLSLETVQSLVALLEKLPNLVKMIDQLERIIEFVTAVLQDKQSTEYLISNLKEYAAPVMEKGQEGLSLFKEVQSRVECNPHSVKLFSLVKWLKDPIVQKSLCYVQATLEVLNEKSKK